MLGLRSFDGFAAGRADEGLRSTFVVLEDVREEPVLERDSPLRACAYASDSNATNVNAVNIAASVAVIVLIIVQF